MTNLTLANGLDSELIDYIKRDLKRAYDKTFLETVTGPDTYGVGNFEVYLDDEEWQIRPGKDWKPAELRGIFNVPNEKDE